MYKAKMSIENVEEMKKRTGSEEEMSEVTTPPAETETCLVATASSTL
jgi:hypothetical protein